MYLVEKGCEIIDATCPFVKKIHNVVEEYSDKGYSIIVAGDEKHPEVQGILGWCKNARVIDESKINTDQVQLLNKVKIKNLANGAIMEYTIVGETEANLKEGKLAAQTPIGKALIGKKKGEVVEVSVPSGIIKFEIVDISI